MPYVDDGDVLTSAGAAASIELFLHAVRRDFGAKVANAVARDLVVPPHRDGGQAQFVARPVPAKLREQDALGAQPAVWAGPGHLAEPPREGERVHRRVPGEPAHAQRLIEVLERPGERRHEWMIILPKLHRSAIASSPESVVSSIREIGDPATFVPLPTAAEWGP